MTHSATLFCTQTPSDAHSKSVKGTSQSTFFSQTKFRQNKTHCIHAKTFIKFSPGGHFTPTVTSALVENSSWVSSCLCVFTPGHSGFLSQPKNVLHMLIDVSFGVLVESVWLSVSVCLVVELQIIIIITVWISLHFSRCSKGEQCVECVYSLLVHTWWWHASDVAKAARGQTGRGVAPITWQQPLLPSPGHIHTHWSHSGVIDLRSMANLLNHPLLSHPGWITSFTNSRSTVGSLLWDYNSYCKIIFFIFD